MLNASLLSPIDDVYLLKASFLCMFLYGFVGRSSWVVRLFLFFPCAVVFGLGSGADVRFSRYKVSTREHKGDLERRDEHARWLSAISAFFFSADGQSRRRATRRGRVDGARARVRGPERSARDGLWPSRERPITLSEAHSLLYQRRCSRPNTNVSAFFKIH